MSTEPPVHMAMMNLLWPRRGLTTSTFYEYWSGAHTQISSRLPGIRDYFQHHLDPAQGALFPFATTLPRRGGEEPGFRGDAEITFASADDLARFVAALAPLMADEQNVFDKTISYQANEKNVATVLDRGVDPAPNGDLGTHEKYMLYVRKRSDLELEQFRSTLRDEVASQFADHPSIKRVRLRMPERYENERVVLRAANVDNYEPDSAQFQACVEIVFGSALERRRFASATGEAAVRALATLAEDVVAMRAVRTFTVYSKGRITTAGLRTPQMAEQIAAIGAVNQEGDGVRQLILSAHVQATSPQN